MTSESDTQAIIRERIAALPAFLAPLRECAFKHLDTPCKIEPSGTMCIGHNPSAAPEAYHVCIYPPVKSSWIRRLEHNINSEVPLSIQILLNQVNGFEVGRFHVYGLPPSLMVDGVLDRSKRQPLALIAANEHWRREFRGHEKLFHFAGDDYSFSETAGYFVDSSDRIVRARKNGKRLATWATLPDMLGDVLTAKNASEH